MTSLLPELDIESRRARRDDYRRAKEETRAFLSLSRENLSISRSDELADGFDKEEYKFRPSRNVLVAGTLGVFVALLCVGLETWVLRCALANAGQIEELRRDVEVLKHRLLERRLLDELKAFEEQLYPESNDEDDDPGESSIEDADYDSDYDDVDEEDDDLDNTDKKEPPILYGSKPSDLESDTASSLIATSAASRAAEILAALRKAEGDNTVSSPNADELEKQQNSGKRRREIVLERSRMSDVENSTISSLHPGKGVTRDIKNETGRDRKRETDRASALQKNPSPSSSVSREGRPPKKYNGRMRSNEAKRASISMEINHGTNATTIDTENSSTRSQESEIAVNSGEASTETTSSHPHRRPSKRHLRAPRQVFAVHYGADSSLFTQEDEHVGNGKARHSEGIFKAWKPSDWVEDLGMGRYFTMSADGRLAIHETGLYLAYAQIHYLDEHDENGFHLLVNGKPILQCMVYSPGIGHKSRSCFSAQVTVLRAGDRLVLKDVGAARYTLFQRDKSFFGLVKLGEPRQPQQRHSSLPSQQSRR